MASIIVSERDQLIGRNIRNQRMLAGLSSEALGEALNPPVSYQQINKYELGYNRTATTTVMDIAGVLEVPVVKLLEGIELVTGEDGARRDELNLLSSYHGITDPAVQKAVRGIVSSLAEHFTRAMPKKAVKNGR